MTHTIREKKQLLARIRRVRGQIEAVERAVETEAGCNQIMHLIAGIRGSMAGLMAEVIEDHVRAHFGAGAEPLKETATEELIAIVHSYMK